MVAASPSLAVGAPSTFLPRSTIYWEPYISAAVRAVMTDKDIEECVVGDIHGQDAGAGFEEGWVEMLELNGVIAATGTTRKIDETIEAFKQGNIQVFHGEYIGVKPYDEKDT